MRIITDDACAGYLVPGHPERPERIGNTLQLLRQQSDLPFAWGVPAAVPDSVLLRAHTSDHLARLREPVEFDGDTPHFDQLDTYARASVGGALAALSAARAGETGFSLMRPPGHHATRTRAMGFCYLNNIAVAALEALATGIKTVAVYDFDVHHGNGTEAILVNQPGAFFYSIHQFPCYPDTGTRNVGHNCFNFPVPPRTHRQEYRHILQDALDHLLLLKPGIIAVSAGFDSYARDPLAQQELEIEDYYWLGQSLRASGVPVMAALEGGYSPDLPQLILAFLRGLEGK
jgi:acetoin utilization deacetylase AcuC-like enzyme